MELLWSENYAQFSHGHLNQHTGATLQFQDVAINSRKFESSFQELYFELWKFTLRETLIGISGFK